MTTAAGSLGWRVAPEQVGVGFVHLDELGKIIDAEACEGRYRLVIGAEDGETTVFRSISLQISCNQSSFSPSILATRAIVKT